MCVSLTLRCAVRGGILAAEVCRTVTVLSGVTAATRCGALRHQRTHTKAPLPILRTLWRALPWFIVY